MIERLARELAQRIDEDASPRKLICIDGPAGAGKTSLAEALAARIPGSVMIHMDDLYDGWDSALSPDLEQRLCSEIRDPFMAGQDLSLHTYDWHEGRFRPAHTQPVGDVLIVEGVGAAQACMREAARLTVFVEVARSTGRSRVIERDGDISAAHIDAWQETESAHFARDDTRAAVSLYITSD